MILHDSVCLHNVEIFGWLLHWVQYTMFSIYIESWNFHFWVKFPFEASIFFSENFNNLEASGKKKDIKILDLSRDVDPMKLISTFSIYLSLYLFLLYVNVTPPSPNALKSLYIHQIFLNSWLEGITVTQHYISTM